MKKLRRSVDRGFFDHGWLKTYHSFSFGDYYDPNHTEFHELRVINEDFVDKAKGFPTHPHRDMEIITYVLSGALEHKDSMGTGSVIREGDVQYMSAGSGVTHSEFNHSKTEDVHLLQIWIKPSKNELGAEPRYNQKRFEDSEKLQKLRLIVSPDGAESSIAIRQDARIYASILEANGHLKAPLQKRRAYWLHLVYGKIKANDSELSDGDALAITDESALEISNTYSKGPSEFLLFELP